MLILLAEPELYKTVVEIKYLPEIGAVNRHEAPVVTELVLSKIFVSKLIWLLAPTANVDDDKK